MATTTHRVYITEEAAQALPDSLQQKLLTSEPLVRHSSFTAGYVHYTGSGWLKIMAMPNTGDAEQPPASAWVDIALPPTVVVAVVAEDDAS